MMPIALPSLFGMICLSVVLPVWSVCFASLPVCRWPTSEYSVKTCAELSRFATEPIQIYMHIRTCINKHYSFGLAVVLFPLAMDAAAAGGSPDDDAGKQIVLANPDQAGNDEGTFDELDSVRIRSLSVRVSVCVVGTTGRTGRGAALPAHDLTAVAAACSPVLQLMHQPRRSLVLVRCAWCVCVCV
jgi:hypothetical protein